MSRKGEGHGELGGGGEVRNAKATFYTSATRSPLFLTEKHMLQQWPTDKYCCLSILLTWTWWQWWWYDSSRQVLINEGFNLNLCWFLRNYQNYKGKSMSTLKGIHNASGWRPFGSPDPADISSTNISHLNNRNFFKYWLTSSLGYGLRAMHVAIFSGCSSHSMWSMFFCCRVSASSFKVVSSAAYKL